MKNNYILIIELKTQESDIITDNKHNRKAIVLSAGKSDQVKKGDIVLRNLGKSTAYKLDGNLVEAIHLNNLIAVIGNINDNYGET